MPRSVKYSDPIAPKPEMPYVDPYAPSPSLSQHDQEPKSDDWRFPEKKCRMSWNEENGWDKNVNS